jgi:two-component system, LytTR family, sensor kinase
MCQIGGWAVWVGISLYFRFVVYGDSLRNFLSGNEAKMNRAESVFINASIITFFTAIIVTHIIRTILKKSGWLRFSYNKVLLIFLACATAAGLGLHFGSGYIEKKTGNSFDEFLVSERHETAKAMEEKAGLSAIDYYSVNRAALNADQQDKIAAIRKNTFWYRNQNGEWKYDRRSRLQEIYWTIILTSLWVLIYMVWHYIEKNQRDKEDRLRLEATVKELELKTIKSHINPHFIFNALNSIRALVDENPGRARTAITELSNILRSSMQAEKQETVPLEKEMNIVKDYLALEQMRFEDRLRVEYRIDEDTLDQQVPPMMVQTLVENAIKHGISKQVQGGVVKIYSDFINNHYELKVQNTGRLNGNGNHNGFGLQSTQDRLKLLFGPNSRFGIREVNGEMVEVTVELPVQLKD